VIDEYGLSGKAGPGLNESPGPWSVSDLVTRARNSDIRPLTAWILALALFFT
jgi:hypothetical protein